MSLRQHRIYRNLACAVPLCFVLRILHFSGYVLAFEHEPLVLSSVAGTIAPTLARYMTMLCHVCWYGIAYT